VEVKTCERFSQDLMEGQSRHRRCAHRCRRQGRLFFVPPEPVAPELEPFLTHHDSGAWVVNRARSAAEFYGVELEEGNWGLYAAARPVSGVRKP
jgi:hypothetical protein